MGDWPLTGLSFLSRQVTCFIVECGDLGTALWKH